MKRNLKLRLCDGHNLYHYNSTYEYSRQKTEKHCVSRSDPSPDCAAVQIRPTTRRDSLLPSRQQSPITDYYYIILDAITARPSRNKKIILCVRDDGGGGGGPSETTGAPTVAHCSHHNSLELLHAHLTVSSPARRRCPGRVRRDCCC